MSNASNACGPKVVRNIFVHAEEVTIVCPICGKTLEESFMRDSPTGKFFPDGVTCQCRRYTYHHSVR